MKTLGFKGSGFSYIMDTEDYLFAVGIQASQYGGQCCVEFGIQPKSLAGFIGEILDFKKLKYYDCELRTRLSKNNGVDQWWQYSDNQEKNIEIANEIYNLVVRQAFPIITLFKSDPNLFEKIEVSDLDNVYKHVAKKLAGMTLMTTEIRFAWVLTKMFENKNPEKAQQFAMFGLSKLNSSSTLIGKADFERVLSQNNGA